MAVPASGELQFTDFQDEFGGSNPIAMSEYYGESSLPASGEIQASDFYGLSSDAQVLLLETESTGVASISFDGYMDSTYDVYVFELINFNPATDNSNLTWQVNASGQSGYNESNITAGGRTSNDETAGAGSSGSIYLTGTNTSFINMTTDVGSGADECAVGWLAIYNPSDGTKYTVWHSRTSGYEYTNYHYDSFACGEFRVGTAIDDIQFKASSGNMDIHMKLYGWSM